MPPVPLVKDAVDLRSDTLTTPTPAMRRAMAEAEVGDDVWEEDPTVQRLEALGARRFGYPAGLFVASGTMGNAVAVLSHVEPGQEVLADAGMFHTAQCSTSPVPPMSETSRS